MSWQLHTEPSQSWGDLPSPLSAHTAYRKRGSFSFPGYFCSRHDISPDRVILLYKPSANRWFEFSHQTNKRMLSGGQVGTRGDTGQLRFLLLVSVSENCISARKLKLYLAFWELSGTKQKGENSLFCKKTNRNYSEPRFLWSEVDVISNIIHDNAIHAHKLLMIRTKQWEIKRGRER